MIRSPVRHRGPGCLPSVLTLAFALLTGCSASAPLDPSVRDALDEAERRLWGLAHGCQVAPSVCTNEHVVEQAGAAWRAIDEAQRGITK